MELVSAAADAYRGRIFIAMRSATMISSLSSLHDMHPSMASVACIVSLFLASIVWVTGLPDGWDGSKPGSLVAAFRRSRALSRQLQLVVAAAICSNIPEDSSCANGREECPADEAAGDGIRVAEPWCSGTKDVDDDDADEDDEADEAEVEEMDEDDKDEALISVFDEEVDREGDTRALVFGCVVVAGDWICDATGSRRLAGVCATLLPSDAGRDSVAPAFSGRPILKPLVVGSQSIKLVYMGSSIVARTSKQSSQTKGTLWSPSRSTSDDALGQIVSVVP